jgi:hypothetical protein
MLRLAAEEWHFRHEVSTMDFANCQHCKTTGTCCNGANGTACERCVAEWAQRYRGHFESGKAYSGLVCSVCWGKGIAEPSQRKWDYRFPAILAAMFVVLAFSLLYLGNVIGLPADKSLPFVGTLVGSITGFYFGGSKRSSDSKPQKPTGAAASSRVQEGTQGARH